MATSWPQPVSVGLVPRNKAKVTILSIQTSENLRRSLAGPAWAVRSSVLMTGAGHVVGRARPHGGSSSTPPCAEGEQSFPGRDVAHKISVCVTPWWLFLSHRVQRHKQMRYSAILSSFSYKQWEAKLS